MKRQMMMRFLTALFPVALALSAAAAPACAEGAATDAPKTETVLPAISVTKVALADLTDRVVASGQIQPVEQVFVQPQIEGQAIDEILAEVGDMVTKDEVLVRLSESDLKLQKSQYMAQIASAEASIAQGEAQVIEARANRDEAQRVWDRTRKLRDQGTVAQASADTAQANATGANAKVTVAEQTLAAAKAQVDLIDAQIADLDLRLSRTLVKAPVAGRIVQKNAQIGSIGSGNGEPLFVIVRDGLLELRADVAEQDVLRLADGQTATLKAVGLSETLSGRVRLVEPTVNAESRLGRVRIAIDASDKVVSGLFAEATIKIAERRTLAAPLTAVSTDDNGASVFVVDAAGQVTRRVVETGIRDGALIEITKGLAEGDLIVAKAGSFVRDGDHVKPVEAATAASATN